MRSGIAQRRQIEGWGFSLAFHGILLGAIVAMFPHLPIATHLEPFRWNVMLVESPQQTTPVEPESNASFTKAFLRSDETDAHSSISPSTDISTLPEQAKNDRSHIAKVSNDTRPLLATPPPTPIVQPQPEISPQMYSTTETTPVTQETLLDEQPKTNIAATPVHSEPSARPTASVEQELPSTPVSSMADAARLPTHPQDSLPVPAPATSGQSSTSQADYSWLQRAVSRRLEELKRSSRPSLEDSTRLKVLVRAVVSGTGDLMEAEIVKSSGLERIDQEAMTLVQRAFPMALDHTLDRPQIVMRIPITYSRD